MKQRNHFYVERKGVLTWLMALGMVCSAVARLVVPGVKGSGDALYTWSQIVLPIAAALFYVAIVMLRGHEQFYKTAIPVWMMAIYGGIRGNSWICWVVLLLLAVLYTVIITGNRKLSHWLLLPVLLVPAAILLWQCAVMACLPDVLFLASAVVMTLGIRVHNDGKYHCTWGDRIDGRKIRTLAPMAAITAYFQVERNTCSNLFAEAFEITHVDRYIRQKRREGLKDFGITHVLLAAYVRGIAKYPQVNRFISGQKVYSRGEDIQYCMVIKKEMSVDAPDTSIKVHLNPHDTVTDVYNKLNAAVEGVKKTAELDSSLDNLLKVFTYIPSLVMKFTVWLLKLLDYFGLLPAFLLELSPFHGTLFFTSMGSLGIRPIYHHLYDFGNLPVFGAFGCKRRAYELDDEGNVNQRKYVDMTFVTDERICDGYYYATFFKYFRHLIRNPELLDNPPDVVVEDIP